MNEFYEDYKDNLHLHNQQGLIFLFACLNKINLNPSFHGDNEKHVKCHSIVFELVQI